MDQWRLKMLPLLAVLLIFRRCAFGFPGGVYSKTHLHWGQFSDSAFASRAVQSSQSESPVTGTSSVDEVGSSLITDRSQKSTSGFSNLRQYVKGVFSKSHETSRTQTGSVSAALAVPQDERQTSGLTSQPQVSSSSSVQNIASQLASGQSLQNQSSSSSHEVSGLQSAGGFSQIVSLQREGSTSGLLSYPGVPSQHTPESHVKLSSSPLMVSRLATTDQSSPSLHMSSTLESSGPLLGILSSASIPYGAPGASTEHVSSPSEIYYRPTGDQGSLGLSASGAESSSPLQLSGAAAHVYSSESLSSSPSVETQGFTFTSQDSPITEEVISSGPVIVTTQEVSSGSIDSPSQSISSQYSPGSLTPSPLGSLSLGVSSQSTSPQCLFMSSAPSRSAMPLASSRHVPVQTRSSSRDLSSPKFQGTSAVYAPSSPQSVSIQSGSDQDFRWAVAPVGTQAGASSQLIISQGGSSSYSGALSQPQSSTSKYSAGSPKPTSPQTDSRPLTSVASSHGSSGVPFGASSQTASQGMSSSFSGSMQSLATSSQYVPSSPTFSKFSSSRLVSSQSTSDPGFYSKVPSTSQIGSWPQSGVSSQSVPSQGGSSSYRGSFPQSQSSSSKYLFGAPKPTSPQTVSRPSASVISSQGSSGSHFGSFGQLASHGMSSNFSGSAQGTFSQPAHSSPTFSKFSSSRQVYSQFTSDPGLYGQLSATSQFGSQSQKGTSPQLSQAASGFNSGSLPQSQGSLGQYAHASPSKYVNAPLASQSFATQSATASSRRGLTSSFLGGSQSASSLTLQGSGSSSMPQGTMSQFVSGSPSPYLSSSLSTTQSVAGQFSPVSQSVFSLSQRPPRLEPSVSSWTQGIQSSGAALSKGNYQSERSQVHSRFSSPLSAGDSRSGAQLSSSRYASLQGGSSAVVGSSQYASGFSPLDAKAALYLSRPSTASLTQGIQTSKTASSQSTSSAQMSSGFSSSLSALSQNVAPVAQSGPMSAVWRSQSPLGGVQRPSRQYSSFQAPSGSTISGRMSERFTSHHASDSSLPPSSGLSAHLSSTGMFSGSSLPKTAQTL